LEQLKRCLDSGWVTQGPLTREFEKEIIQLHQVEYALATTSCTAALHLAVLALGLGPGDEVVVPAFTWITSGNAAEYAGAKTVFADVDPRTYNLDVAAFEKAITPRTRAVIAVHLFGLAADMDAILAVARRHNIKVIEDAACAIATTYNGQPVGGFGEVGCFSFHPRKIVTTGEGGMVTTNSPALARRIASLRNHGSTGLPPQEQANPQPWSMATFDELGFNYRLSDIQAAIGMAQLAKLQELLAERRRAAQLYTRLLSDIEELVLPTAGPIEGHTYQSYVVRLKSGGRERRNALMTMLQEDGIQTRPGTHAVHRLGYYRQKYGLEAGDFPNAALCEDTTITLPIFPGITPADQERVSAILHDGLSRVKE
jgi:dTDP-4-amino-4,6-dideoxygalactose transaminase